MSDSQFTYPKGIRITSDETEFIASSLMGIAEAAKKQGDAKMFNLAMGLSQRVKQAEMAGGGVPPDLQERLQSGLQRAVASNKPELAQRALENYLATMIRLHPDPARALSVYIVRYINDGVRSAIEPAQVQSAQEAAAQILERVRIKLASLTKMYSEDADGWPESEDLLSFLYEWTSVGIRAVDAGDEPWEGDDDIAAALTGASSDE
jgi:hypothetical protein